MEQHADAVKRGIAASAGRGQERRFQRDVDDVGGDCVHWQRIKLDVQRGFALHALAGHVDRHGNAVERIVAFFPGMDLDRPAEFFRQFFRPFPGAVDQPDFGHALVQQRVTHRPAAAAGSDDRDRSGIGPPVGAELLQVAEKPQPVVIGPEQRTVVAHHDAADSADLLRDLVDLVNDFHRILLVRDGQIAAGETQWMHGAQRRPDLAGFDRQRHIGAGKALLFHPVVVHHGRTRMHHRPTHDSGHMETVGIGHEAASSSLALK